MPTWMAYPNHIRASHKNNTYNLVKNHFEHNLPIIHLNTSFRNITVDVLQITFTMFYQVQVIELVFKSTRREFLERVASKVTPELTDRRRHGGIDTPQSDLVVGCVTGEVCSPLVLTRSMSNSNLHRVAWERLSRGVRRGELTRGTCTKHRTLSISWIKAIGTTS